MVALKGPRRGGTGPQNEEPSNLRCLPGVLLQPELRALQQTSHLAQSRPDNHSPRTREKEPWRYSHGRSKL